MADTTTHGQLIAKKSLCLMVNDNGCTAIEKCIVLSIVADVVFLLNVG